MLERRAIKRRFLSLYLQVFDVSNGYFLGYLANISAKGIMTLSKYPIETHKDFVLEIRLSNIENAVFYGTLEEKYIRFHAQSRWSSKKVNPPLISTGFMLTAISTEDLQEVNNLIEKLDLRHQHALTDKQGVI